VTTHCSIMHNAFPNASAFCVTNRIMHGLMESPADRLRSARLKAGFETAKEAAEAMGVPASTYIGHENGNRGFTAMRAAPICPQVQGLRGMAALCQGRSTEERRGGRGNLGRDLSASDGP